jgi:hypothetical protein
MIRLRTSRGAAPRLAAAALLLAVPASAEVLRQPDGHLRCSALPGRFESRTLLATAEGGRLAGRIRLIAPAWHRVWWPSAGFLFGAIGGHPAGVYLGLDARDPRRLTIVLRLPTSRSSVPVGRVARDEWIPVSAALGEDRMLTVTVAGRTFRREIHSRQPRVPMLMCSSGSFEFELDPGMRPSDERFPQP